MAQLWFCLKTEDCLKIIAYQDKFFPKNPLIPPGENRPLTIKSLLLENVEEIDKIMRKPPVSRRADD